MPEAHEFEPGQGDESQPRVYRTQAQILYTRAGAGDTADDHVALLALLKDRVRDPAVLAEADPFFFRLQCSNGNLDSYGTRMQNDTLENYVADADAGISLQESHIYTALPLGGSLRGLMQKGRGGKSPVPSRMYADMFIWPDQHNGRINTNDVIAGVRRGVYRDCSISFYGGQITCSIDGFDMFDYSWLWDDDADFCPHYPGLTYTTADGSRVMAEGLVENAHMSEVSLVYDGACPEAMTEKVFRMVEAGRLPTETARMLEARYRMQAPVLSQRWAGVDLGKLALDAKRKESPMGTRGTGGAGGDEDTSEQISALEARISELEGQLAERATELARHSTALARLTANLNPPTEAEDAVEWSVIEIARLRGLAEMGGKYRAETIEGTLAEGVRAFGNTWDRERYQRMLEGMDDIESIKALRADFARVAKTVVPTGRGTGDGAEEHRQGEAGNLRRLNVGASRVFGS